MRYISLLIFLLVATPVAAVVDIREFDTPQMESDYNKLIDELRCLVCQNQNLAESDAELAQDLRQQTFELLQQGQSRQQVMDYMVERYGDFVLYRPQIKTSTYLLWFGPFALLVIVLIALYKYVKRPTDEKVVAEQAMDRARQILLQDEEKS